MAIVALLMCGLGLFFIGVRSLSANLVPLVGRRARAAFARALLGPFSTAASGTLAGMITQSSTAVSWIVVAFVRGGVLNEGRPLLAPTWSNVGTALLPLIVAIDTSVAAGIVIGMVGFATYFRLARGDRMRNALDAALGAALLLYGMHLVSVAVGPVREGLMHHPWWDAAVQNPWVLGLIGAGFSLAAQSSSVAAAIAVAAVGGGLLTIGEALPLVAGANAAAIVNNAALIPGETTPGRVVFALQAVQKAGGSLLLVAVAVVAALRPDLTEQVFAFGHDVGAELALVFLAAQVGGSLMTMALECPTRRVLARLMPMNAVETLSQPAFLLREALTDPAAALDLSTRELARLSARLPLLLDHVREEGDPASPTPPVLRAAGTGLSASVKAYLAALLDAQPGRHEVAVALLLDDGATNAGALHEAVAEYAEAAEAARALPTAQRLTEALHLLLGAVAEHAESLGADEPDLVLSLLGHRDHLMKELRERLSSQDEISAAEQNALFRMTVLFERIVWLARRLVNDFAQVHRSLAAH
ncbi:Na+/Picotransporter [Starkeya koreensis]|uniref:Na+/Picotransporter n=1 Tax=Ancylobacter koreensis TaxID=266121 RepID=A0ABT0DQN2_9HYPH|nr:Na+/Picotransporter [Ancylobacter koreensis]MCK0209585.1 Na+/Picotransporter [Ancylobacter koreensis]